MAQSGADLLRGCFERAERLTGDFREVALEHCVEAAVTVEQYLGDEQVLEQVRYQLRQEIDDLEVAQVVTPHLTRRELCL